MYLTQEDYRKIEQWLKNRTIKDTEFPEANPLSGKEKIAIVQDNVNRTTDVDTIFKSVSHPVFNVTDYTNKTYNNISEALLDIPETSRKKGVIVTFGNSDNNWSIWQFTAHTSDDWNNTANWANYFARLDTVINSLKGEVSTLSDQMSTHEEIMTEINNTFDSMITDQGTISANYLPSYVDDVLEFNTTSDFPTTGETGKIYVTKDSNLTFRWSGTQYIEVGKSVALGTTSDTAYPGDKGQQNNTDITNIKNIVTDMPECIASEADIIKEGVNVRLKVTGKRRESGTWRDFTTLATIPLATNSTNGLMSPADKSKVNSLPLNVMVRPEVDESVSISATDNGFTITAFNTSIATYDTNTGNYIVSHEQPMVLPKFSFFGTNPGLIGSDYAEYLRKLIYEHRAKGNVATAELVVAANKISFDTSVVQVSFDNSLSNITESLIVPKSVSLPIATNANIGLMSINYAKAVDALRNKGFISSASLRKSDNTIHVTRTDFGEGSAYDISLTPAPATSTINGLMSAEDKVKLDNIAVTHSTLPTDIISVVEMGQNNVFNILPYSYNSDTGEYSAEEGGYFIRPDNATTEMDGYMSKEDKATLDKAVEDITTINETKANVDDLSNVLAEEVADSTTLEGIDTFTREEAKKDLFIDMWNQACGRYGRYNAETGYFELNGLTDITYEKALDIYNAPRISYPNCTGFQANKTCRTLILYSQYSTGDALNFNQLFRNSSYEVLNVGNISIRYLTDTFYQCNELKNILGIIDLNVLNAITLYTFMGCNVLTSINIKNLKLSINFKTSPLLSLSSFQYMITNAANTSPITITVHPDVYAKLTDTTNTEWNKVLTDAAAKQITFATA